MKAIGRSFWERDASDVARELVMRPLFEYRSLSDISAHGVLLEVDAYDAPVDGKGKELFEQKPGIMGAFASRRGPIPVITAHARGKTGLITLRNLRNGEDLHGPNNIAKLLQITSGSSYEMGSEGGVYVGDCGLDLDKEGIRVVNKIPSGSPKNRVAYWKAVRS